MHEYVIHFESHAFLLLVNEKNDIRQRIFTLLREKGIPIPPHCEMKMEVFHERFNIFYESENIPDEGRLQVSFINRYDYFDYCIPICNQCFKSIVYCLLVYTGYCR